MRVQGVPSRGESPTMHGTTRSGCALVAAAGRKYHKIGGAAMSVCLLFAELRLRSLALAIAALALLAAFAVCFQSAGVAQASTERIAFVRAGDVWTITPAGGSEQQLTSIGSVAGGVDWSPNGGKLAFGSGNDIWVINADGSGLTQLTSTGVEEQYPKWSPDGQKIAFGRGPVGGPFDVYVMDANGSNVSQLTTDPAWDFQPSWTPDGTKILFTSNRSGDYEVWSMNVNGSNQQQLMTGGGFNAVTCSDGTRIAFTRGPGSGADVWVMNSNGSGQQQLTTAVGEDNLASWSPDCSRLTFYSNRAGGDVWTMNADGSTQSKLTSGGGAGLDWSPAASVGGSVELAAIRSSSRSRLPDALLLMFVVAVVGTGAFVTLRRRKSAS